jgi:proteasome assembly chaperone (PAC2) family protein
VTRIALLCRIYRLEIDAERLKVRGEDTADLHREIDDLFRQLRGAR